jgi:hypothetical protein
MQIRDRLSLPPPQTAFERALATGLQNILLDLSKALNNSWEDLRVPVNALKVPTVNPPVWTDYSAGQLLAFETTEVAGNEEQVFFTVQIPHSYRLGSDIIPHVHWVPAVDTTDATEGVRWGLEYEWVNMEGTFSTTDTIYALETLTKGACINTHQLTSFSAITGSGKGISSMLVCRLFRNSSNGADTYDGAGANALLLEIDFHYEIDTIGSRSSTAK